MEQMRWLCRALPALQVPLPDPDGSALVLSSLDLPGFRRWPTKGHDFPVRDEPSGKSLPLLK